MKRVYLLLLTLCWCGIATAQQVPDINDVYAADQGPDPTRLGPAQDPGEVLDDFEKQLLGYQRLDYTVKVTITGTTDDLSSSFEGNVAIGRSPGGDLDRFRIDMTGSTPSDESIDLTLGSSGDGFYVIDRARQTISEFDSRDGSSALGDVARYVLISDLTTSGLPVVPGRPDAGATGELVHFVDSVQSEHVYCLFSEQDKLPRLIERVVLGPDERARVVRTVIANLQVDGDTPKKFFEPNAPKRYRRIREPATDPEE